MIDQWRFVVLLTIAVEALLENSHELLVFVQD